MNKRIGSISLWLVFFLFACTSKGQEGKSKSATNNNENIQSITELQKGTEEIHFSYDKSAPDFRYAARKAMPAVVHVRVTFMQSPAPKREFPFWDFFGEEPFMPRTPRQGSGSGVIITPNGYIVTNNHVVNNADTIRVTLYDNRTFVAELIGTDPSTDLALLKINTENLPFLKYGNSDSVEVGEWVLAVGNPFNLSSTVTAGIVSAKARNINILQNKYAIESFIQTDAAVNPGNSGGALVNLKGELIGINTAIASPTGAYAGYAFAIPVNIVKKIIDDLLNYGSVQRGYLGIMIRDMNSELAKQLNINQTEGVYVDDVVPDGAADEAGLKPKDVIIALGNTPVKKTAELIEYIARHRPNEKIQITYLRNGKKYTTTATLKAKMGNNQQFADAKTLNIPKLGIQIAELSQEEKQQFHNGVKVISIGRGPIRAYTRMRPGFIITHVDDTEVESVPQFQKLIRQKKGGILLRGRYPDSDETFFYGFKLK